MLNTDISSVSFQTTNKDIEMKYTFILVLFFIAGCSTNDSLYFGTYTRVGIEASTDGAGIGAKNAAFNIMPPKDDGSAFDVIGTSDIDIAYTQTVIKETFAVGKAAVCAASKEVLIDSASLEDEEEVPSVGPIIFGTYSSWSLLDLSWGDSIATGINFGYKRGTGVKMPVVEDHVGSVYASISVNTTTGETIAPKSNIDGTRSIHTFATGTAAIIKASQEANILNGNDNTYNGCITFTSE